MVSVKPGDIVNVEPGATVSLLQLALEFNAAMPFIVTSVSPSGTLPQLQLAGSSQLPPEVLINWLVNFITEGVL